jgi:hypothetical protein
VLSISNQSFTSFISFLAQWLLDSFLVSGFIFCLAYIFVLMLQSDCHVLAFDQLPKFSSQQSSLPTGKTGNFATWKFLASQTDDKWWLTHFLAHVTTFYDLRMTLMTNGDNILMTLKTNGEDTLRTLMTDGEDTLTTCFTISNYLWLPRMTSLTTHATALTTSMVFIVPTIETKWQKGRQCEDKED